MKIIGAFIFTTFIVVVFWAWILCVTARICNIDIDSWDARGARKSERKEP